MLAEQSLRISVHIISNLMLHWSRQVFRSQTFHGYEYLALDIIPLLGIAMLYSLYRDDIHVSSMT